MINDKKKRKARSRKPHGSLTSRIRRLESLIEELADALEPSEMKVVFYNPHSGHPEPDMDELPKGTIIVRMESPYEIRGPSPETAKNLAAKREVELAKAEAERQAEIDRKLNYEPSSASPQADTDSHSGDKVIAEGFGWRWGVQSPIQLRFKNSKNNCEGMKDLSRKGII